MARSHRMPCGALRYLAVPLVFSRAVNMRHVAVCCGILRRNDATWTNLNDPRIEFLLQCRSKLSLVRSTGW